MSINFNNFQKENNENSRTNDNNSAKNLPLGQTLKMRPYKSKGVLSLANGIPQVISKAMFYGAPS